MSRNSPKYNFLVHKIILGYENSKFCIQITAFNTLETSKLFIGVLDSRWARRGCKERLTESDQPQLWVFLEIHGITIRS